MAYSQFTQQLHDRLEADPRVLGLVAVGSMAQRDYVPDAWSDHDFFVVTRPGAQEAFRADLGWLPGAERILLQLRETAHGLKVMDRDGHLLEFAVFDPAELHLAKVNRYRVLLDRERLHERMAQIATSSREWAASTVADDRWLLGNFVTTLLVGGGRARRGEELSGVAVLANATRILLQLVAKHVPAPDAALLDELDPHRRFAQVHADVAWRIIDGQRGGAVRLALALGEVAREVLGTRIPEFPHQALEVVLKRLAR